MNVIPIKKEIEVSKDELDRQTVGTAIVIMHGAGRYYEAMDLLCRVVGWPPLVRGFATPEDRDAWLAKMREVLIETPISMSSELQKTTEGKSLTRFRKCKSCNRWYDPSKVMRGRSIDPCRECGRRFNQNRKGISR